MDEERNLKTYFKNKILPGFLVLKKRTKKEGGKRNEQK